MKPSIYANPTYVHTKIVSAKEFNEAVCDKKFCRMGYRTGRIGDTYYICLDAPEKITGFLPRPVARVVTAVRTLLGRV